MMAAILARLAPVAGVRVPRPTARLRLTLVYAALFLLSGAALLAVTWLLAGRATATASLPDGLTIRFGNPPKISASRHKLSGVAYAGGHQPPILTPAQLGQMQAQAAQLHAFDMRQLLIWSAVALSLMGVLSAALGWLVAGRVLRPVRMITATARRISATSLHERLSLDGPHDEFRDLAATLDDLLGRLEAAFDAQRRFVASASHELRTPLTLDRALLERALRNPQPTQALWHATCERLLASAQYQERLIDAMLALARSEAGLSSREPVELSAVIDTVLLSPGLGPGHQALRISTSIGPAAVCGDPRLIERLVRNLVDNAIRYNQPAGRINISARTQSGRVVLAVANTGPVISPADVQRLFQPFQRLAPHQNHPTEGNGLGLSIVKAIADAHDATTTASPQPDGGLAVQVSFPAASPPHGQATAGLSGAAAR
jgi:signal transduction histidine kinase